MTHGAILSWDLEKGSVVQTLPISASFSSFDKGFFPEEYSDRGFATYSPQLPFLGNNGQYLWVDSTRTSQKGEGERYLFTSTWLTGERSEVPFFAPFKGRVYALASSDDGQRMVAALNVDKELICLNAESGQKSWSIATPHRILSMKFASRGDRLGVADTRGNLRILETETGKLASALAVPIQERLQFAFSPDADRIAIAVGRSFDEEGEVRVCDVESGQTLIKIPLDSAAESVEFTPDGLQLLATDHKGRLWTFDSVPRSLSEKIEEVQEKRVGWHLDRVAEAESSKNYRAAVWHMDQLLALQPEDASLESRRASLLSKTGDFAHLEASELERMERTLTLKSLSTAYRLSAEYIARRDSASHQRLCRRLFEMVSPQTKPYDASQIYRLGMFCPDGVADLQAYIRLCEERFFG